MKNIGMVVAVEIQAILNKYGSQLEELSFPGYRVKKYHAGLPRRPAGHLDGHVSGLGVPLPVLLCTLRARQVAGTAGHLNLSLHFIRACREGRLFFTQYAQIIYLFFSNVVCFRSCFCHIPGV